MAFWRLEKSCYCCYLKTGCIIVAVLSLIFPIATLISLISVLAVKTELKDKVRVLLYIMVGTICVLVIPINILLLFGTIKEINWPLIVWLVVYTMILASKVYYIVVFFDIGIVYFIVSLIFFVISSYMCLVVYSHIVELSELSEADSRRDVQPADIDPEA